ncbi:MAG TPA: hypothetical protein VLF18_02805 [Tahibacter sp.]|uniref:TolB family protein n=1 Tax=Tahibacter sp. TaxID=2056211 RepID=UPI002BE0E0BB|nr:hypothetical protein [Tahibacter sp.]HSX59108.1 hypothetical protein [Tahibacter sp.]
MPLRFFSPRTNAAVAGFTLAAICAHAVAAPIEIVGEPVLFARGIASTEHADIRLSISPDGRSALWFSRRRPGGPGSYDIWLSRRGRLSRGEETGWSTAEPVSFNSTARDFDPAFSADGRFVYFCSDRAGGLGGSDLYRVAVAPDGFGHPEALGPSVNSAADEFAPMLSPDGNRLLFSSDRNGGAGGHDLYFADRADRIFAAARRVPGALNTVEHEFDATLLADGATLVFSRARGFATARVDLFVAQSTRHGYDAGTALSRINSANGDTYGPMLDWSDRERITYSARRDDGRDMDLYRVRYRFASPD